jgi:hypothetical protein
VLITHESDWQRAERRRLLEAFAAEPHVALAYRTTRTHRDGPGTIAPGAPSTLP